MCAVSLKVSLRVYPLSHPSVIALFFGLLQIRILKLYLSLTNIRIDIIPPLRVQGDIPSRFLQLVRTQIHSHNLLALLGLAHRLRHWVNDQGVPIRMIARTHIPRRTTHGHVNLIIHRPRLRQQLPVQRPRREVEGARVDQRKGAFASRNGGQLGEAHIVADGYGDGAVPGQVDEGELVAGSEDVGLAEGDLAGDVDVEEVDLPVGGEQGAVRAEGEGGVVVFLGGRVVLRDGAANEEDVVVRGHAAEGGVGGSRVVFGFGEEDFGVVGEVVGAFADSVSLYHEKDTGRC